MGMTPLDQVALRYSSAVLTLTLAGAERGTALQTVYAYALERGWLPERLTATTLLTDPHASTSTFRPRG